MLLRTTVSSLALAGCLSLLSQPAAAQSGRTPETNDPKADQTGQGDDDTVERSAEDRAALIAGRAARSNDGEIIVTGTRINRPNTFSAAPITSVTVQDIQAQAPLNVEEVLNRLPQIAPDAQQNYQDSDGRQRIKLRSLGFERTLVLVDGKRLGTQNGQDTNIIPASLLERIDVLSGGASSVYGSDAVSGVVNFILRKDFSGLRVDTNYNFYNHLNRDTLVSPIARASGFGTRNGLVNDGGRADLTVTAGTKLFDDRLKVSGFFNYKTADQVNLADRSSSACYLLQTSKDGPLSCQLSTYSPSGYISPRSGANSGRAYVNDPAGTRSFVAYGAGPGKAASPFDNYALQRQDERYTAGGFVNLEIAPEAELYGSATWFRDRSFTPSPRRVLSYTAFGSAPYQVNCNNPFLSAGQATLLGCAAGATGTVPIEVRYRFEGQPYASTGYVNEGVRATGGIRGKVGDAWNYDIGGVFARNQQDINYGPYADPVRVNRSLNVTLVNGTPTCASAVAGTDPACVPFDAFRAGSGNTALTNYLFSGASDGAVRSVGYLYDVVASVSGDLTRYGIKSPWADEGAAIALATEYRRDKFVSSANAIYTAQYGDNAANLRQDVWESNVELQAPLVQHKPFVEQLQVNGGYRVSKYSSNPATFSTWKVEGLFAPVADLTFRGSYNKAQRAPTVIEIRQATTISYGSQGGSEGDFCAPTQTVNPQTGQITYGAPIASREVCRATGLSDALYGSQTLICPDNACTVRYGGFTADPETAYTLTYGLVVKPRFLKGLVFSADRYQIRINNSLGYNDYDYYYTGCLQSGDPFFCSGIVRNPGTGTLYSPAAGNPTTGFFRGGTSNYYRSISRGWDFQGQYTLGLGKVGRLDWSFNGSLTTFAGGQDSPLLPERNCSGYYGNGCGQLIPKWTHGLRTTYTTPDSGFNVSFNWQHLSSLVNANNSGDPAIGGTAANAQTTFTGIDPIDYFDLALTFNVARSFVFRVSANNLFDVSPPIIANSRNLTGLFYTNTIPPRYNIMGRQIAVGTTVRF